MSDTQQLISKLDKKVDGLIEKINHLKLDSSKQKGEVENLNKLIAQKDLDLDSLKKEISEKKVEVVTNEKNDTADIKIRINELVREIDNCISLLKV